MKKKKFSVWMAKKEAVIEYAKLLLSKSSNARNLTGKCVMDITIFNTIKEMGYVDLMETMDYEYGHIGEDSIYLKRRKQSLAKLGIDPEKG